MSPWKNEFIKSQYTDTEVLDLFIYLRWFDVSITLTLKYDNEYIIEFAYGFSDKLIIYIVNWGNNIAFLKRGANNNYVTSIFCCKSLLVTRKMAW